MEPKKKTVDMPGGAVFEYWVTPMSLQERDLAQKQVKTDNPNDYALILLVDKAKDKHGNLLFQRGDIPTLKNDLPADFVEQIMLQLIVNTEEVPELDIKSLDEAAAA